jgi:hypothetical protein
MTRDPFIRLAHPPEDVMRKQNHLAQVARTHGAAGEHLLTQLWPAAKSTAPVETCEREGHETKLADLLRIMRDEGQDVKTRIEAAEEALRIKDAQVVTVNIVKYGDVQGATLEDMLDKLDVR